jgi:glucokinase
LHGEPFFAVDVGASTVKSGIVLDGTAQEVAREPVAHGLDGLIRQLVRLREAAGADAWGLCIAGLVDADAGTLRYSANLGLRDAPLVELLSAELPAPLVFANDLDAAAVGEADGATLALIQVGTGIAGRYVVEGRVVSSASGQAGEVGHLRFRAGGRECSCGKRGCAEAYGGWHGIASRYAEAGQTPELSALPAGEVLDDALEAIGVAASALVAVCDPGTLRVGGGVARALGEMLLEAIRSSLAEQVLPDVAAATVVEAARSGDAAALCGLYALAAKSVR